MQESGNQPQFASIHGSLHTDADVETPPKSVSLDEAYALLAQRTFEITLIHQAGVRMTRQLDLIAICRTLNELVGQVMDCASLVVSSYDRAERLIRAEYVFHDGEEVDVSELPPLHFDVDEPLEDDAGTQGKAIRTGKSLLLNDFEAYALKVPGYYYEDGEVVERGFDRTPPEIETTRAALIVPLKLDAQVTGVVQVMSYTLGAYTPDQLHFLEALAPQAAIALQNARLHEQLRRLNTDLERLVEARTSELQAALAQQREISAFKAQIVSMVAHDFRTPLTIIQSSASILERYRDRLSPEKSDRHFRQIEEQIQQLSSIIDDALFVGKADSSSLQPHRELTDVAEVVQTVCTTLESKMPERNICFVVEGTPRRILMDAVMLRQAVTNLLTNALKYSPNSSEVHCSMTFSEDTLKILVRDQGIGIPADDLPRLFTPFHRASNVGKVSGTGLGLVIVQRVAEALNGTLEIESVENKGTRVTLRFPLV